MIRKGQKVQMRTPQATPQKKKKKQNKSKTK